MPIDPSIALAGAPTAYPGFDFGHAVQGANNLVGLQNNKLALQANQQQMQSQNALKQILSQPGALDANGNPTAEAMQRVMSVDPAMGMKLHQNSLVSQEQQLRMSSMKTKEFGEKLDLLNDSYGPVLKRYKDAIAAGKTPEQAAELAQTDLNEVNQRLGEGGMFSETEQRNHPTKFDPIAFQKFFDGSAQIMDWRKSQAAADKDKREDAHETETERHNRAMENRTTPADFEVMNDPNGTLPDGTKGNVPYRIRKDTGEAWTLDNKPYTPSGAQKLSSGGGAAPMKLTDDDRKSLAAQAATGQPLTQIMPGYRQEASVVRQQIRSDAIKKIMADTGMSAEDAGTELANRTIEYQSGKKSSAQLTTMLGGTKQAVGQLSFNIDKVKEDLTKLPASSDMSPLINAVIRGEEKWTGDPAYSQLFYHMSAVAVESARILSGGQASTAQLHQGAMEEAKKWANVNMTPASFDAVAKSMKEEGEARIQTYEEAIKGQRVGGKSSDGGTKTDAGTKTGAGKTESAKTEAKSGPTDMRLLKTDEERHAAYDAVAPGKQFIDPDGKVRTKPADAPAAAQPAAAKGDNAAVIAAARAAIAKGAPRDKVIQRLKDNGISPEGL